MTTKKFITKNGLQTQNIDFTSPDDASEVLLQFSNDSVLSIEGTAGQLFSIADDMTGTIFSVNDVSGIPSIEVLDTGLVKIAQYGGNVLLGTSSDNGSKLQIAGNISGDRLLLTIATGTAPLIVNSTTLVTNLNADLWDGNHFSSYLNQAVLTTSSPTFNNLTLSGDLTVNGTATTINAVTLTVDDKNIELGSVASPTDVTANGGGDTNDGALGLGYYEWVSGEFDPTAFSITGTTTYDSWTSTTLVLRPALSDVPIYGNYKNSGVWALSAVYDYFKVQVPLTIPGLKIWLDADDDSTLTYSSGSNIATWTSKANGTVYTTTSATLPTLSTVSGLIKPAVLFPINQTSYLKTANPVSITTPHTIFMVVHWGTITATYASIGLLTTDTTNALQGATGVPYSVVYTSTAGVGLPQIATTSSIYTYSSTGIAENSAGLFEYTFNTTMTNSNLVLNGSTLTRTTGAGTSPSTVAYSTIGTSDTLYKSGGAIAEIVVYEGILSESQTLAVRSYLKTKWGTP